MAKKLISKKMITASTKLANVGDFLLSEEGHEWEIDEFHLVPTDPNSNDRIVCRYVFEGGRWVLVCTRP